ncbi:hypothetical protein O6P43_027037 [Quillaja saponaria]|uniref:Uncharacterized protein n=1 Tax=Quillaja saponaria TaxID=32244 RepID=A0AAD7L3Z7_QUISA|nr:hypothetical protein O6P43_027037 [Quillaja saponaria]
MMIRKIVITDTVFERFPNFPWVLVAVEIAFEYGTDVGWRLRLLGGGDLVVEVIKKELLLSWLEPKARRKKRKGRHCRLGLELLGYRGGATGAAGCGSPNWQRSVSAAQDPSSRCAAAVAFVPNSTIYVQRYGPVLLFSDPSPHSFSLPLKVYWPSTLNWKNQSHDEYLKAIEKPNTTLSSKAWKFHIALLILEGLFNDWSLRRCK